MIFFLQNLTNYVDGCRRQVSQSLEILKTASCVEVKRSPLISEKVISTQFSSWLVCVTTDRPHGVREAVIYPHMTSSPGVTNDSLQFITCRQKRWRNSGGQHIKIMTDDEAQISVNGNPGHRSITFRCFLCNLYVFVIKGLYWMLIYYLYASPSMCALENSFSWGLSCQL